MNSVIGVKKVGKGNDQMGHGREKERNSEGEAKTMCGSEKRI